MPWPRASTSCPSAQAVESSSRCRPATPTLVPVAAPDELFTAGIPEGWTWRLAGRAPPPSDEPLFPGDGVGRLAQLEAQLVTDETRLIAVDPNGGP